MSVATADGSAALADAPLPGDDQGTPQVKRWRLLGLYQELAAGTLAPAGG